MGAVVFDASGQSENETLMMRSFGDTDLIGVPPPITPYPRKRYLVIIDNAEAIQLSTDFDKFFYHLAVSSVNKANVAFVALCSTYYCAERLLTARNNEIVDDFDMRWDHDSIRQLVSALEKQVGRNLPDVSREGIIQECIRAGTASFTDKYVRGALNGGSMGEMKWGASELHREWNEMGEIGRRAN